MRTIIWLVIAAVWLLILSFIGYSYFHSPSKSEFKAVQSFISVSQQHVNGQQIDINSVEGSDANADYVRIFAAYLNKLLEINKRLADVKNGLIQLAQPATVATGQSAYELLEKENGYEKQIMLIRGDLESEIQDVINKMNGLDKKEVKIFDIVSFTTDLSQGKAERDKEISQYTGLAAYVKTMLEFVKTRTGKFQLGADGGLHFGQPADQEYYNQLVTGINQYVKLIDDLNEKHNKEDRKLVNDMSSAK